MRIIPVIDLQDGVVVRGVAGDRARYQAVASVIAANATPQTVAHALVATTGARELYVADLNAIAGAEPDWDAFRAIAAAGVTLLIDTGIRDSADAIQMADHASRHHLAVGIIAALESSGGPHELAEVFARAGRGRAIFSLDLKNGKPVTSAPTWRDRSAEQIADVAVRIGFRRLIVLDVARVGVAEGPGSFPVCEQLRSTHPHIELIAGGGIRHVNDLERLASSGCDAALVASALHNGTLTAAELRNVTQWRL